MHVFKWHPTWIFWNISWGFTYKSADIKIWGFQCAKMLLTVMAKGEMAKVSCHQIGYKNSLGKI